MLQELIRCPSYLLFAGLSFAQPMRDFLVEHPENFLEVWQREATSPVYHCMMHAIVFTRVHVKIVYESLSCDP